MKLIKIVLLIFLIIGFFDCGYDDNFFSVGQIWQYKTRSNEPNSTLTIVSIENNKDFGVIVGVYIDNLNFENLGEGTVIHFLPFSKETLKMSVVRIKDFTDNLPDYKDSYKQWKEKFERKQCSIMTNPVAQILDTIESNIKKVK
jgi:hypothetical protein